MKIVPFAFAIATLFIAAALARAAPINEKFIVEFHQAMTDGNIAGAKKLIAAPEFSPTMPDYGCYTVFEATLRAYSVPIARLIMASPSWKKVTWNARNTAKPLLLAASDAELLPVLQDLATQSGFDPNTPAARDGEFPVMRAAKRSNLPALRWLVAQPRVNVNKRDKLDRSALLDATPEAALILVKSPRFDANARSMAGETALHEAVRWRNPETVRALLALPKINPNIRDQSRHPATALDLALAANKYDIAKALIENRRVRSTPAQRALFKRMHTKEEWQPSNELVPFPGTMTGSNDYPTETPQPSPTP